MARKVDREVMIGFIEEAKSYLPAIAEGIDTFRKDSTRLDGLEVAHRHAHTIKGASSMVGLTGLSHIAYAMEEALEEIGAGQLEMNSETAVFLKQTMSAVDTYLDGVLSGDLQERPLVAQITKAYRRARGLPEEEDETAVAAIFAELEEVEQASASKAQLARPTTPATPSEPITPEPQLEDISPELLEAFSIEAEDHLRNVGTQLAALDKDPNQPILVQEIRRAIHTVKGGAGTVGIIPIARLSHRMEDVLDLLYEGQMELTPEVMTTLFSTADALEDLLHGVDDTDDLQVRVNDLYGQYTIWLGDQPAAAAPRTLEPLGEEPTIDLAAMASGLAEAEAKVETAVGQQKIAQPVQSGEVVRVPLERLDELVRSVSELVITRTTFEQHMGGLVRLVDELWHSFERLRQVSHKLETDYEVTALSGGNGLSTRNGGANGSGSDEFDDLQMDRYTEFHLLSRELTETTSDLRTIGNELRHVIGDFDGVLNRQGRLSSEIQDKLMRTRMVPLATIVTRLHRAVRVVSQKQGKQIDLNFIGETIELDKKVLEEMADPLLHILRNAVDHGIEPPALRMVMGKPERGQITLKSYYQGNQVVLEISDDGAGLEPEILRAKAVASGYVSEADAPHLSTEELHSLIFLPGFSTAEEVSEVSGRGVGLDILKNSVHKLKGTIKLNSVAGQGATFTIRLPMTLAVTRALLVKSRGETFAVPLAAVSQILRAGVDEYEKIGQDEVVRVGGKVHPLLQLGDALGLPVVTDEAIARPPILILDAGATQVALVVDEILEGREIVVKTLGNHLRHVHAVTGATLMGDGSIVLILNPAELATESVQAKQQSWSPIQVPEGAARKQLSVLIVDDSVSVRRVVTNLIKNAGWHPSTAKDGLDALEFIQGAAQLPDVILLDIEMPRMDGYELASTLQAHDVFKQIPIVMLTSRAGEKHRRKALDIGAAEYLVKPYQDETLLNVVRRLTAEKMEN